MRRLPQFSFCIVILALIAVKADAEIIDFELTPDGSTPTDNAALHLPYAIDGGGTVKFFFDTNGNNVFDRGTDQLPVFEQIGANDPDGFHSEYWSDQKGTPVFDRARPGYGPQLGQFFLRQPDGIGVVNGPFMISYDTPQTIREFSGEIWDIDKGEKWRVDVLNPSGSVLATRDSPVGLAGLDPASLDSLPWNFAFTNLPDGVQAIRLTFIGAKTDGIGLAFNNFSATRAVPEPTSLALLTLGTLGLLGYQRRHKQSSK
ncbi:MAG: PEP-CTERM sorting domain-containing protein [Isosphaeraceae bacterium]